MPVLWMLAAIQWVLATSFLQIATASARPGADDAGPWGRPHRQGAIGLRATR